ncbi:UNVERIFIED_CONTAM: hypothetical protein PYX00_005210 [Menopon gallinae]|uniref:Caspase activity and apoptosis inhibitor 1 n=1 Tax=Menopon gallinae TaxID=328185 RepID=A0AAW2HRY1_9NEOP
MSINSKHSAGKNDKSGRRAKRKKTEDSEDLESSEEELDLTKECHPIGYYMNDRAEMINQMFSVIKGIKLKAMLPPILKDCDLDLLKLQCLDQLLGMSEKRIACILSGETLETSSESDVESKDYDSEGKNKSSSGTTSNGSDESMEVDIQNEVEKRSRRKTKKKSNTVEAEKNSKTDQNNANPPAAEQGKTLLEILELEMRARAIRALLKQNEGTQDGSAEPKASDSKENGVKDMSDEVVDLTGCEDDDYTVVVKKEQSEDVTVDEKVSTFEEKVEKSQTEKGNQEQEVEKAKRLQAELELRNKLFKKKTYRTKQQRMENEEDEEEKVPGEYSK